MTMWWDIRIYHTLTVGLDDLGLRLKPNLPQSERCPTSNPWVQSPCWLGVVTSINTHTDEHEAGMAGKYPFKTCPKIRNVNNHVQPPPNNQFLWVSIPCWYFVPGVLHLNQPARSPLSDLTSWVFRCTGCWTTKRIRTKITERIWDFMPSMTSGNGKVGTLLVGLLSDSANGKPLNFWGFHI